MVLDRFPNYGLAKVLLKATKKSQNVEDTPDDLCLRMLTAQTTGHFILKCPNFNEQRNELCRTVNPIVLANNMHHLTESEMVHLFHYGDEKLKFYENKTMLKVIINFIGQTSRCSDLFIPTPHALPFLFVRQRVSINIYHPVGLSI